MDQPIQLVGERRTFTCSALQAEANPCVSFEDSWEKPCGSPFSLGAVEGAKERKGKEIPRLTLVYTPKPVLSRSSQNVCLNCFKA